MANKTGRPRTGSVLKRKDGTIWARVTYFDPETQKRKDKLRRADNKSHANRLINEMLDEIETHGEQSLDSSRMTFAEFAENYEKTYLKEAKYVDNRKVSGLRSVKSAKSQIKPIKQHFGKKLLRSINTSDAEKYKAKRLETPTNRNLDENGKPAGQRTITSVNRELALLRRMFNVAISEGWYTKKNPVKSANTLISVADEKKRERILTKTEERALLAACTEPREVTYTRKWRGKEQQLTMTDDAESRKHLKPILICALDTGMRRGEILKLRWHDIDFDNRLILVQAHNTKTMKERSISMTNRLFNELQSLFEKSTKDANKPVFGFSSNVKRSFDTVRRAAGIDNLRFHDLRHTAATRLIAKHVPLSEVSNILGHTNPNTTYRYVNADVETARRASAALDSFHAEAEVQDNASDMVN
jgi:integrase